MPDSLFTIGMNAANTAFGAVAGEKFEVVKGDITGEYMATSIDDLVSHTAIAPGGFRGENQVLVWVSRAVITAGSIKEGQILLVRGKRVRIVNVTDDGDNTPLLTCASAGVKM